MNWIPNVEVVGLPQSSPLIKFAILPKNNPGGDENAIKSPKDNRLIFLFTPNRMPDISTPKKPP